jgi:hypothetical protein
MRQSTDLDFLLYPLAEPRQPSSQRLCPARPTLGEDHLTNLLAIAATDFFCSGIESLSEH